MVGSRCSGKALLVPVEMPAIGTSPQADDHGAMGAVAAQHDDGGDALLAHLARRRAPCRRRCR